MGKRPHGGVIVARHLKQAGATHVFTLCGGHISPILVEALNHGITVVDVRDEASAVFAADAHARLTGRPGVAVVAAGPGVTNTVTAVKNAQLAQSPVILIGGAVPTLLKNHGARQDIKQLALMHSLVKWQTRAKTLSQLDDALFYGLSIARSGVPGPVFIEAPMDLLYPRELVQSDCAEQAGLARLKGLTRLTLKALLSSHLWRQESLPSLSLRREASRLHQPLDDWRGGGQVAEAGNQLARARRPMLIVGSQALVNRNPAQAQQLADKVTELGVPVWTIGMARGLLGASHPLLFHHHRREALAEADMVIVTGLPFDFRLDYGRGFYRNATVVSANLSTRDLSHNRRPTVAVNGHPADFITTLVEQRRIGRIGPWLQVLREREASREAELDADLEVHLNEQGRHEGSSDSAQPGVSPRGFFRCLDQQLEDNDILIADGGDFAATAAGTLHPRKPLCWLDPGVFEALGAGGGFALGAATARPDSQVWLLWGDGASAFSLAEFDSFARQGMSPIAIVGNNAGWGEIAREQQQRLGSPVATGLRLTDYHRVAEGYGGKGLLISHPDQVISTLQEARRLANAGSPVCINLILSDSVTPGVSPAPE